jgi:lysyl-tRNA synthetase class 1
MHFAFEGIWLQQALHRAIEAHKATPEHFVAWANRLGLFDDVTFLIEGVTAWYEGDLVKAVHVLVPQMERGLRNIVGTLDKPVTKQHPTVPGVSVAIGMGDILYSGELVEALGPDLTLYFLTLYADPRGMNLRNRIAHGLIEPDKIDEHIVRLLIHTMLVLGVWKELAKRRR